MRIYCKNKTLRWTEEYNFVQSNLCTKKYDIFVGHSTQSTGQAGPGKEKKRVFVYPNVCMYITISLIFEYITTCNALQVTSTVRDES